MNEFFSFQHEMVIKGLSGDEITTVWECLDHIRTKDIHPAEVGYPLDVIQLASEWDNQFNPDYSYMDKFL